MAFPIIFMNNENSPERMAFSQLTTHTAKLTRALVERFQNALPGQLAEFRDLTRPVRRRSVYPAMRSIANSLVKLEQLVEEEVQDLIKRLDEHLDQIAAHAAQERGNRRDSPRREGNLTEVFLLQEGSSGQPLRGWIFDRSAGGLGITVPQDIPIGSRFRVLPAKAPRNTPWMAVEIRNCRLGDEGWEIGCQFLATPPKAVLALFG